MMERKIVILAELHHLVDWIHWNLSFNEPVHQCSSALKSATHSIHGRSRKS